MKNLLIIVSLFMCFESISQTEYYRFPNTYLFIQPPNTSYVSKADLIGLHTEDQSSFIRAENFTIEEEPMVDQFYLADFNPAEFEEKEIEGALLKYAWKKAKTTIHTDTMYIYGCKVLVNDQINYSVMGFQKDLNEETKEQILESIRNMKVDTNITLDPFLGKSFQFDLDKIGLKYCEAFKSDWMVKLTSDGKEFPEIEDKSSLLIKAWPAPLEDFDNWVNSKEGVEVIKEEIIGNAAIQWKKYLVKKEGEEDFDVFKYYHQNSSKSYEIDVNLFKGSEISEDQIDEFVKTFELK